MKKILKGLFVLILVAFISVGGWFVYDGVSNANQYERHQPLSTLVEEVKSRENYVPYDQVQPALYQATLAIEDARYYNHGAVDFRALARAFVSQFVPFIPKSGGSTISMQVVKNLYGQYDGTAVWKAAEIVLAHRLEQMYSKDEILSIYVNIINYGDNHHGIYEASVGYFGVHPLELTLPQATILAGIPQSPGYFQLSDHYDQAKAKQQLVLQAMVRNDLLTQQDADLVYEHSIYDPTAKLELFAKQEKSLDFDLWTTPLELAI